MQKLLPTAPWTEDFTLTRIRLIGAAELLGALGLILPAVTMLAAKTLFTVGSSAADVRVR